MKSIMITSVVLLLATSTLTAPAPTPGEHCVDKLVADILVLTDGSNSINAIGWGRELDFVVRIIKSFLLGPSHVQFAVGTFSNDYVHVCDLNTYTDQDELSQVVLNITHLKGETYTDKALRFIRVYEILTSPSRGARPGVSKKIVLITDGDSNNKNQTIAEANALRALGIQFIVIGVGSVKREELRKIAGVEDNVFSVKDFSVLAEIKNQITQRVCEAPVCTEKYKADVYNFIDASGSINSVGHGREVAFQISLLRSVPIGPDDVQYGLAQFSNDIDPRVEFNTSDDFDVIAQRVNSSQKTNGGTFTARALEKAIDDGHVTGYGRRWDVPLLAIINTDGRSANTTETVAAADRLRSECNATVIVLTVGSVNDPEIIGIARDPRNVFSVKSLSALESIKSRLLFRVCEVASKPTTTAAPTTTTTTTATTTTTTTTIDDTTYVRDEAAPTSAVPDTTTAEPDTTTAEPDTTTEIIPYDPDYFSDDPRYATAESETTTPEPETTTAEPETTTLLCELPAEPETTTPEPETATPVRDSARAETYTTTAEPETTTPEPETTTPVRDSMRAETYTTTAEPETSTPEPETATPVRDSMRAETYTTTGETQTAIVDPVISDEPITTTPEPGTTVLCELPPEPESTTPEPETTTG